MSQEQHEVTFNELTDAEKNVQRIIRQVHGEAISGEQFIKQNDEIVARLSFDASQRKYACIEVNLSNLASKQKNEGLTDAVLKYTLQIQP